MIEKTRKRFIRIAVLALSLAMILVVTAINVANWIDVRNELWETLGFLSRFSGPPPAEAADTWAGQSRRRWGGLSEARYFSVMIRENGERRVNDHLKDDSYPGEDLLALADEAAKRAENRGRIGSFLYCRVSPEGTLRAIVFLNCETRLERCRQLMRFSLFACLIGITLSYLIVKLCSHRIVQPMEENLRRMKRFITDASHELKTPLTVISANMDVLELDQPDNTWIRSTQKQTANLRRMVDEMVYLTRVEEKAAPLQMEQIELAPIINDAVDPYSAMAEFSGRSMHVEIDEGVRVKGDRAALLRLFTIFLDNAVKYAPVGASIELSCIREGRHAVIMTRNPVEVQLTADQCRRLFDRFYRVDESRTKNEHAGYGIGLSIAAAIAEQHGGRTSARMADGQLEIRCQFPLS